LTAEEGIPVGTAEATLNSVSPVQQERINCGSALVGHPFQSRCQKPKIVSVHPPQSPGPVGSADRQTPV